MEEGEDKDEWTTLSTISDGVVPLLDTEEEEGRGVVVKEEGADVRNCDRVASGGSSNSLSKGL